MQAGLTPTRCATSLTDRPRSRRAFLTWRLKLIFLGTVKSYPKNPFRDSAKLLLDFAYEFKSELGGLGAHFGKRPAEKFSSFNVRDAGRGVVSQITNVHIRPPLTRVELQLTNSRAAAHCANHIVIAWRTHQRFAFFVEGPAKLLDPVHRTGRLAMV